MSLFCRVSFAGLHALGIFGLRLKMENAHGRYSAYRAGVSEVHCIRASWFNLGQA